MKHFISFADLTHDEVMELLDTAEVLKEKRARGKLTDLLKNRSLAMFFEKSSTRTRVSFEVSMSDLGGQSIFLSSKDLQIGRGETIADTAVVLSRYVHCIAARVNEHSTLLEIAAHSSVPVINALSDVEHPCQILSDLLTIREYKNHFKGLKYVWVGDGNNVCNSAILGCAIVGMQMVVACPPGYEPNAKIIEQARELGGDITIMSDPFEAVKGADVLYTDVWISMGDEHEIDKRLNDLKAYQIDPKLLSFAKSDAIVMHCMPAHRGQEITAEVMDGPQSVVYDQAENRLHAQKALLMKLID
ncbi:MAG: ornithine carbamoyltransferase [Methanomethylovorans sp.]|uniref:ornithine carbamoyltransferase n=1 Tax=Methanomethylovorans sp. TaxID=2758717 RepID=UPI000A5A6831|nr:ornithine carbamoyltransferase [Methanomethylovorans sp.]